MPLDPPDVQFKKAPPVRSRDGRKHSLVKFTDSVILAIDKLDIGKRKDFGFDVPDKPVLTRHEKVEIINSLLPTISGNHKYTVMNGYTLGDHFFVGVSIIKI
jgi:hypothetical protein